NRSAINVIELPNREPIRYSIDTEPSASLPPIFTMSTLIATFRSFPKELFRVNNGPHVSIRPWSPKRRIYDILVKNGRVQPKSLDPSTYRAPNGASMRPNSPYQQHLASELFHGSDVLVYAVPKGMWPSHSDAVNGAGEAMSEEIDRSLQGTRLPDDLLLVHERTDHYSLQPARDMTLDDLNDKATSFFLAHAKLYTRNQWLKAYPAATEFPPFGE
ncbi:Uncharacterized protein TPAR_05471, partial [Tolypocladium paradoxum]